MAEGLCATEVVIIERFDATQCLVVSFSTDRTKNLAVIICQQLIEDMNAKITSSACEQNITDWLTLALTEIVETVGFEEGIQRCKVLCFWGVDLRASLTSRTSQTRRTSFAAINKRSQRSWRLLGEQVVEDDLYTVLASLYDDLDGIDAGTTNLEEVICSTHLLNLKDVREDSAEELFHLALRSLILCGALQFWSGQCLAINLTVRRHRHHLHLHIDVRYHVFGQRRSLECCEDGVAVDGKSVDHSIVEYEVFVALYLAHLGSCLADTFQVQDLALNLA